MWTQIGESRTRELSLRWAGKDWTGTDREGNCCKQRMLDIWNKLPEEIKSGTFSTFKTFGQVHNRKDLEGHGPSTGKWDWYIWDILVCMDRLGQCGCFHVAWLYDLVKSDSRLYNELFCHLQQAPVYTTTPPHCCQCIMLSPGGGAPRPIGGGPPRPGMYCCGAAAILEVTAAAATVPRAWGVITYTQW